MAEWEPTGRAGEKGEDLPLREIVGQAIGTASTCWVGGMGDKEFDGVKAAEVLSGVMVHIERSIEAAWQRGYDTHAKDMDEERDPDVHD